MMTSRDTTFTLQGGIQRRAFSFLTA